MLPGELCGIKKQEMNSNHKKRKKAAFNTYKAVRTNMSLNNFQPLGNNLLFAMMENNYESRWMEQVTELKPDLFANVQVNSIKHKLIMKWWENN